MKLIRKISLGVIAAAIVGTAYAQSGAKAIEYTSVSVGGDVVSEGLPLVNAIQSGNWKQVEAILDRGIIKIDDVICIRKFSHVFDSAKIATALECPHMNLSASPTDNSVMIVPMENLTFSSQQYRRDFGGAQMEANRVLNPDDGDPLNDMYNMYVLSQVGDMRSIAYVSGGVGVQSSWLELYGTPLMVAARLGNKYMVKKLLAKGANPNVFIRTGGVLHCHGEFFSANKNLIGCIRPWICALIDTYSMIEGKSARDMSACASMLIDAGAYFPRSTKDDQGRTMLWDAVMLTSPELVEICVKRFGLNVNEEDNLGKTVSEYLVQAGTNGGKYVNGISATLRKLRELGANVPMAATPREMDASTTPAQGSTATPSPMPSGVPYHPQISGRTSSGGMPKEDHSAEIAALQHRLLSLRMELEDARANRKIATIQGTGWVSASMYEQRIMREISDCERRIMELRNN